MKEHIALKCQSCSSKHNKLCCSHLPENAILAFGNGSDVKTGASQPGMPSPATDNQSPHLATTTTPGVSMETEQNILRAQIPTQVRRNGRLKMWCTTFFKLRGTNGDGLTLNWVTQLQITRGVCFNLRGAADGWDLENLHNSDSVSHTKVEMKWTKALSTCYFVQNVDFSSSHLTVQILGENILLS